jgi:hypothetical protein
MDEKHDKNLTTNTHTHTHTTRILHTDREDIHEKKKKKKKN